MVPPPGDEIMAAGPSSAFWSTGQQWALLPPVLLALFLTALIGIEREARAKSAGVRTHTLVGFGAAVFVVVSKYGVADVLAADHVALDPSRIAAQVVSGVGFIGGGLIFVHRRVVRGLSPRRPPSGWPPRSEWPAAQGLPVLAVTTTAAHYLITVGFPPLAQFLSRYGRQEPVLYLDGRRTAAVVLRLTGRGDLNILAAELSELPDIRTASTGDERLDE